MGGILSSYFFNNFLRFFTEGYLEISFGVILNVASFTTASLPELISLVLSFAGVAVCFVFPGLAFVLLYDKHEAIRNENKTYLKRFGTMYQDFKTNGKWYQVQYYPLFMIRRLIFVV